MSNSPKNGKIVNFSQNCAEKYPFLSPEAVEMRRNWVLTVPSFTRLEQS